MELRQLINKEHIEWKERMVKESNGTYVLYYIAIGFFSFANMMDGFKIGKNDVSYILMLSLLQFIALTLPANHLAYVMENGTKTNIFKKFKNIPIDMNMLIRAKILLFCRCIAIPVFIGQVLSIIICLLNPDNEGGRLTDVSVWLPIIIGILALMYEFIKFKAMARSALK